MYRITKALNNNVARAEDENKKEFIVFGKGIAFNKGSGDSIDHSLIYECYFISNKDYARFSEMIDSIPAEVIYASEKIISEGKKIINGQFNANILLMIADHISFAIERYHKNMVIINPLQYEIQRLYHKEVEVGKKALEIVNSELGISLPDEEIAMIAMHFVNSQTSSEKMHDSILTTKIINDVFNMTNFHFQIILDESSNNVNRFLIHLRYFINKYIAGNTEDDETEATLYEFVIVNCNDSYECVIKISNYLKNQYGWDISINDRVYLILHINRLIYN